MRNPYASRPLDGSRTASIQSQDTQASDADEQREADSRLADDPQPQQAAQDQTGRSATAGTAAATASPPSPPRQWIETASASCRSSVRRSRPSPAVASTRRRGPRARADDQELERFQCRLYPEGLSLRLRGRTADFRHLCLGRPRQQRCPPAPNPGIGKRATEARRSMDRHPALRHAENRHRNHVGIQFLARHARWIATSFSEIMKAILL